jgi:hypothetical protein
MMINCKECNKEISDKATACPHCGAPRPPETAAAKQNTLNKPLSPKVAQQLVVLGCLVIALLGLLVFWLPSLSLPASSSNKPEAKPRIVAEEIWEIHLPSGENKTLPKSQYEEILGRFMDAHDTEALYQWTHGAKCIRNADGTVPKAAMP